MRGCHGDRYQEPDSPGGRPVAQGPALRPRRASGRQMLQGCRGAGQTDHLWLANPSCLPGAAVGPELSFRFRFPLPEPPGWAQARPIPHRKCPIPGCGQTPAGPGEAWLLVPDTSNRHIKATLSLRTDTRAPRKGKSPRPRRASTPPVGPCPAFPIPSATARVPDISRRRSAMQQFGAARASPGAIKAPLGDQGPAAPSPAASGAARAVGRRLYILEPRFRLPRRPPPSPSPQLPGRRPRGPPLPQPPPGPARPGGETGRRGPGPGAPPPRPPPPRRRSPPAPPGAQPGAAHSPAGAVRAPGAAVRRPRRRAPFGSGFGPGWAGGGRGAPSLRAAAATGRAGSRAPSPPRSCPGSGPGPEPGERGGRLAVLAAPARTVRAPGSAPPCASWPEAGGRQAGAPSAPRGRKCTEQALARPGPAARPSSRLRAQPARPLRRRSPNLRGPLRSPPPRLQATPPPTPLQSRCQFNS
ncbi:collagen alpha-1(III) chain-like [Acinonyx jubatus]|uniref:Collagen alpha-1(III) chain-like n=1 Tax=Acinonyx jubatus TaxID=32536 RepID=A0ABM3P0C1_ACIJB|nr:collagen alpha-1(III) chain-like [Acinonyx jubatus]